MEGKYKSTKTEGKMKYSSPWSAHALFFFFFSVFYWVFLSFLVSFLFVLNIFHFFPGSWPGIFLSLDTWMVLSYRPPWLFIT